MHALTTHIYSPNIYARHTSYNTFVGPPVSQPQLVACVVGRLALSASLRRTAVLARVAPAVESVLCPGEEGAERESSPPLRGRRL